jgi:hypothetical protein
MLKKSINLDQILQKLMEEHGLKEKNRWGKAIPKFFALD